MSSSKPVLGYWQIRGLGHPIRLLLTYSGVDFENKMYGFGPAPEYNYDSWMNEKFTHGFDFPNVPYWKEEDLKITESKAILRYITRTRAPALLPATPQLLAFADMVDGFATDLYKALVDYGYAPAGQQPTAPEISQVKKFEQLAAFIGEKTWVLGDKISYIDFYVAEVLTQYSMYKKDILSPYPVLASYLQRFESLPQIKEHAKITADLPAFSPDATIFF